MQLSKTERNHYIPQFYLKNFSNKNGALYSFDKKKPKTFYVKPINAGLEKDLYTVKNKITMNDISCMRKMCKIEDNDEFANITLPYLTAFLNDDLISVLSISPEGKDFIAEFKKFSGLDDEKISYNQELLFCEYENQFKPSYDRILTFGKIEFFKNEDIPVFPYILRRLPFIAMDTIIKKMSLRNKDVPEIQLKAKELSTKMSGSLNTNEYYDFIHYITMQNLRTPKFFNAFEPLRLDFKKYGINSDSLKFLFIHYQSAVITNNIIVDGLHLILLKNSSEIPFITSDAPVINPHAQTNSLMPPDIMEFYFPLSPKYAILITKNCSDKGLKKDENLLKIWDNEKIKHWNNLMIKHAYRFLYSNDNSIFNVIM